MIKVIRIENKKIGEDYPAFIVAELSANHMQKFELAVKLIKTAKKYGVDAVKMQTYTPDSLTLDMDSGYFRIKHPKWKKEKTLYRLYQKAYTPRKWFRKLKKIADDLGVIFFSTAFDKNGIDLLEELKVPVHKIASFELTDLPLIEYAAKTGKPLILSTGMATKLEIEEAVNAARRTGTRDIILLKCVSSYPAKPEEMNLRTIPHMKKIFNCPVGLSDHTLGIGTSVAAVSLGARVIERHFTLSRKSKTPDNFFSLEPQELKNLVNSIRLAEHALGSIYYGLTREEKKSRIYRRSLFAVENIKKGEVFTEENVRSIRPGYGLPPKCLKSILGKKAKKKISKGSPLKQDLIDF